MGGIFGGLFGGKGRSEGGGRTPGSGVPPPPAQRTHSISIGQTRGKALKGFFIPDHHAPIEGTSDAPWRLSFLIPREVQEWGTVQVWADGYPKTLTEFRPTYGGHTGGELGVLPPGDAEMDAADLDWSKAVEAPGAWAIDGQFCRDKTTWAPVVEIGTSAFAAFPRFVTDGEGWWQDYAAYLVSKGFNTARSLTGYWGNLGQFNPTPFVDRLPRFWEIAGEAGLRIQQTIFADTPNWLPDPHQQLNLFMRIYAAAVDFPFVRLEGGNELDDARNRADGIIQEDLGILTRGGAILASHGSTIQDGGYLTPVWNSADYHPARDGDDWPRKCGHNAAEDVAWKVNVPTFTSEIKRPDEDANQGGGGAARSWKFYEAGANIALHCAGGTFHSNEGKAAQAFQPLTDLCAGAFVQGMHDVPLEFRTGTYTAGHLSNSPVGWKGEWQGRAHAKILGNRSCVVLAGMRPEEAKQVQPQQGWGLVERRGPYGEVILLGR